MPAALRQPLADWLLALERQRYAPPAAGGAATLATLRRDFHQLQWPRAA